MAAMLGVSLMVMILLVFLLVGGEEGAMRDMETTNRFVLVGFTAFLGCVLVLYGMVQNRMRGGVVCAVLGGGLLAMPVLFPGNPTSASEDDAPSFQQGRSPVDQEDKSGLVGIGEDYQSQIGYGPVADALKRGNSKSVIAVYIRNAPQLVRDKIAKYLYVETGKVNRGVAYSRRQGLGDSEMFGLIVMEKQKVAIEEVATMCRRFGRVNKVHEDLRVVDVTADPAKIAKLNPEPLLDASSPSYYRQQLDALQSFDSDVQMKAVKILGISEPKVLRDDLSKALVKLLPESRSDLQLEIINTLRVWSKPGDGAEAAVLQAVKKLHKNGEVSEVAMGFLIDRGVDGSELILMDLWKLDPVVWSDLLLQLGEGAQVLLLPGLNEMDNEHLVIAADILGAVGSKSCITHLEKVMSKQSPAGKKSLQAAIDEIKKRL